MRPTHRRYIAAIIAIAFMASAAPAQPTRQGAPLSQSEDAVVIHTLADAETLNLITSTDGTGQQAFAYVYESLTMTDPATLESIPWLAESLPKASPDGLSYEVTLRRDARFSDGTPVTGADIIFYLKAIKNPFIANAAPQRGYVARIDRAELIGGDPYRLRFVMTEPYFLGDQIVGYLYAAPKHRWDPKGLTDRMTFRELNDARGGRNRTIREYAEWFEANVGFGDLEQQIGSGPYRFERFDRNERLVMVRNDDYWNRGNPLAEASPKRIVLRTINDPAAAVEAVKHGEVDMVPMVEKKTFIEQRDQARSRDLEYVTYDYPAYSYIGYNEDNPIFADKRVRMAMSHAVNAEEIIRSVYYGYATRASSPLTPQRPEHDSTLPLVRFDLAEARRLLREAGWIDSNNDGVLDKKIGGKRVDFQFTIILNRGNERRARMAGIFIDALSLIDVRATAVPLEWAVFLQKTRDGNFDAYIGGWAMNTSESDPYQIWHSASAAKGGSNTVRFRNARVDTIIERLHREFDVRKRIALYHEFERILFDEQPYTFLVSEKMSAIYRKRLTNVRFSVPMPGYYAGSWHVGGGGRDR
jgi:ABC-type transport system substrate-binding protein